MAAINDLERSARPSAPPLPVALSEGWPHELTDRGNARRLFEAFGDNLLWCAEWGFGVWDGCRYVFDAGEVRAYHLASSLPEIIRAEAAHWASAPVTEIEVQRRLKAEQAKKSRARFIDAEGAERHIRGERRGMLEKHAEACGNVAMVERALRALRPLVICTLDDLNADPWTLAVENGAVDLRAVATDRPEAETEEEAAARRASWLKPHDRASRPTRVCSAPYEPEAECPQFMAFLELIQPKAHMRAYLKRALGGLVFGRNDWQIALLFQGEGANGKSTLMNVISAVLGSYTASCQISMFLVSETRSSSAATPDEAALPGARVYVASEPEPDAQLSDSKVKGFTGGDKRSSRANFGAPFEWRPTGTPVLSFNRMPSIKGDSYGTRRRIAFVPFGQNLHNLPDDRKKTSDQVERELAPEYPGILNWLLEGFFEARQIGGLAMPAEADVLKEALLSDSDPVGAFINSCTKVDPDARIRTSYFYSVFEHWAKETGVKAWQPQTVKKIMMQKGIETRPIAGYPHWFGITWNDEDATRAYRAAVDGYGGGHP